MISKHILLAAGMASVLGLSGCATPAHTTKKLERRIAQLERQSSNQGLVEMMNQIQQLRTEVQQLRGESEGITHGIDEVKERQKALYLDLDHRMLTLEGKTGTQQPTDPSLDESASAGAFTEQTPGDATPRIEGVETEPPPEAFTEDTAGQSPELYTEQPLVETAQPSPATATAEPAPGTTNEKAAYQDVFDTLKQGRYDTAIEQFNEFLVTYPYGEYTDNAQYWLAEAYYVTRNFPAAQQGFQTVLDDYPHSAKAPDALLKIGFIEYEQAQWVAARDRLYDVIKRYPESSAARLANKRLLRMKNEKR